MATGTVQRKASPAAGAPMSVHDAAMRVYGLKEGHRTALDGINALMVAAFTRGKPESERAALAKEKMKE